MIKELGGLFGWSIFALYCISVLNYILKVINKNFKDIINKNENISRIYKMLMKIIIKYHKYFGGATLIFLLFHFIIEFTYRGLNITGAIAAILMIIELLLGVYGVYKKKRDGLWFYMHRIIAILLGISIVIHLL